MCLFLSYQLARPQKEHTRVYTNPGLPPQASAAAALTRVYARRQHLLGNCNPLLPWVLRLHIHCSSTLRQQKEKTSRLTPHIQATCAMTRYILYFSLDFPLDFADFRDIKEVHEFAGASLAPGGGQWHPESVGGSYLRGGKNSRQQALKLVRIRL